MKQSKQILLYTAAISALAVLEIALSALYTVFTPSSVFLSQIIYYLSRMLAVIPPFLMLGTAIGAIRVRTFTYALVFVGIYAAAELFTAVPLSLFAYLSDTTAYYGVVLFSYMLSSLITALLFFLLLVLGFAIFLQGKKDLAPKERIFSVRDGGAAVLWTVAGLLTVYNLVTEVIDILSYAKDKLYILSSEDIFDMLLAILFPLFLCVFCFVTGRMAERWLPTVLPEEDEDEADDFLA